MCKNIIIFGSFLDIRQNAQWPDLFCTTLYITLHFQCSLLHNVKRHQRPSSFQLKQYSIPSNYFFHYDRDNTLSLNAKKLHRVSKKLCKLIFCHNFAIFRRIVKIFGTKIAERTGFSEVYSFSTSPNLCQHTTV